MDLFQRGEEDLTFYLNNELIPEYVDVPIKEKLSLCRDHSENQSDELYSQSFLDTFERSVIFETCKSSLEGKIKWKDWSKCSKLCSDDLNCGEQTRTRDTCLPSYAECSNEMNQVRKCKCNKCDKGSVLNFFPYLKHGLYQFDRRSK